MSDIRMPVSVITDGTYYEAEVSAANGAWRLHKGGTITFSPVAEAPPANVCISCGAKRQPNGEMPCDH